MIRRPPRSTLSSSSAASDVYKRQGLLDGLRVRGSEGCSTVGDSPVSYTHLRAHETRHDLVCRLLLEKKKNNKENKQNTQNNLTNNKKKKKNKTKKKQK